MATRRPPAQQQHPQPQRPQQPRLRSLRIGVILGGNIIEERLVRKRETITIGQSVKNTFSIPVEGLPRQWPLFMVKDGRYFIHFSNSMDGRISDGGQIYPIATLKGHGAQQHGEGWVMPLTENARGKIVLGEMTLLFQFVSAPPLQPRPHLPASVRGSLADRIEPQLSIIVALSICMHFSVFFYAKYCHDPGTRTRAEQIYKAQFQAEKVVDISFDEPVDGAATGAEDKPAEDKPAEDPGKKGGDKGGDKGDKGDAGKSSGPSDEELEKQFAYEVGQMFSDDDGESGDTGRMADRSAGDDLGAEVNAVKDSGGQVTIAKGGDDGRGPRRSDDGRATTGGPSVNAKGDGTGTKTGDVSGPKVKTPNVKINKPITDEDTTLTPALIMKKIRGTYAHALKQCFKRVLKNDPDASGTIKLKFTVGERGNVTSSSLQGFGYDDLDACVKNKVDTTWRFTAPKDADGDATSITVKLSLPFSGT